MLKILGATSQNVVELDLCTFRFSRMHWHFSVSHAECIFEDEDGGKEEEDDERR